PSGSLARVTPSMYSLLAAVRSSRPIIVERGGTPWWIPFATALFVAVVAALASWYATWRFKRSDVNRENALPAVDLGDEAERLVARVDRYETEPEGGGLVTSRLLQEARVRAEPLGDGELDDRFRAALGYYVQVIGLSREPPGRARYWLYTATVNIRLAL